MFILYKLNNAYDKTTTIGDSVLSTTPSPLYTDNAVQITDANDNACNKQCLKPRFLSVLNSCDNIDDGCNTQASERRNRHREYKENA